ncbi:MAG: toll/interleukin-1 receptor domain-containing protein [Methanomassiliicoccales archaeon]|nr:MAG: toll/interleukin-1 receptor domain-containing protein [Methanomassiliicoccales archaeon]
MKAFISYYHGDGEEQAIRLEKDLKEQNIAIWIDKKSTELGRIWLQEIDEALYLVDYVLGVVTEGYLESVGGVEAYATITKGLKRRDIKFVPLFFISPSKMKSVIIPAIGGINFSEDYKKGLHDLIKHLKAEADEEDAKDLLTKIESPLSPNPFRRVRAEFFYDDYKTLAYAFAEPEKEKYDMIREAKPIVIFGGRGSGKTMILKSMIPEVLMARLNVRTFQEAKDNGADFFGIYFRLKRGSLLIYDYHPIVEMGILKTRIKPDYELYKELIDKLGNYGADADPVLTAGLNAAWTISLNEINLKILKTTLQKLKDLKVAEIIRFERKTEEEITREICRRLNLPGREDIRIFVDLNTFIDGELGKIERYLQDLAIPFATPTPDWCRTGPDFLDEVYRVLSENLIDLKDIHFYLLFDEFENLRPFQQVIVNEWIKTARNFTVKIATKFNGMYTNETLQGQPLQDGQDYFTWTLDYNLFNPNEKKSYQSLLSRICGRLLEMEGYEEKDIRRILEEPKELELPREIIDKEIENIRKKAGLSFSPNKMSEYRNKLELAAIFRLQRKREKVEGRKSRKKVYAGFETFTYLSFGITRIFQNLLGMSFYKAEDEGIDVKNGGRIPVENQTWAAYIVSRAWLEKIPSNLEEYGEVMYQFIVDLGDIFRERLLHHSTEPETLTISLTDPSNLSSQPLLNHILTHSVRESVMYERKETSSMKPKESGRSQPREFVLNRVYSPILEISYRPRWPRGGEFTTSELAGLLDGSKRSNVKKQLLLRQLGKKSINENTTSLDEYVDGVDSHENNS